MSFQSSFSGGWVRAAVVCSALGAVGCSHPPAPQAALPEVEVTEIQQQDVPIVQQWVATMDGSVNAQVRAQISGYLIRQRYRNGDFVRKGTPLFDVDPRPMQAAVNEAKAAVDQAEAKLKQAYTDLQNSQAQRGKTQLDLARSRPLAAEQAISRQELDDAVQADLATQAQVAGSEAAISAAKSAIDGAKAKLETANLNLNFTTVLSPVDGIAGINIAQIGDLVGPTGNAMTTVSTVDPILVSFTLSEQEYLNTVKRIAASKKTEEAALAGLEFTLQLTDDTPYPLKGRIHSVDRGVDVKTGSIVVQTEFPNPGNVLRPGGFGRLSTVVGIEKQALLVPQRSLLEIQGKYFAAVVDRENKVKLQPVEVGTSAGSMRVVTKGLAPGEKVIVEGIQKVRDGIQVQAKEFSKQVGQAR